MKKYYRLENYLFERGGEHLTTDSLDTANGLKHTYEDRHGYDYRVVEITEKVLSRNLKKINFEKEIEDKGIKIKLSHALSILTDSVGISVSTDTVDVVKLRDKLTDYIEGVIDQRLQGKEI